MASIDQTVAFLYSFWQMKLPTTFRARRAGESLLRRQSRRFLANATTLPRAPEEESAGCQNPAQGRPKNIFRDHAKPGINTVLCAATASATIYTC
mgnify:CR=1 FL=1